MTVADQNANQLSVAQGNTTLMSFTMWFVVAYNLNSLYRQYKDQDVNKHRNQDIMQINFREVL